MTIEGLGKKFQEARLARGLTLDEAARMTKIRPSRLAEIEAEDFSQFPSLAYAKGFLLIYGKFLDVDVTPYLEAFEGSEHVTVDGYSYLQDNPAPKPARTPAVRRTSSDRKSATPLIIGIVVLIVGFFFMKLILNIQRIAPRRIEPVVQAQPRVAASTPEPVVTAPTRPAETATQRIAQVPATAPPATATPAAPPVVAAASPRASKEPEVRRAEPVRPEDLAKAAAVTNSSPAAEPAGANRVVIRPLKKTYVKVVVDNEEMKPAFERWISPADGTMEFRGQHIAVRVLDRDAVQIKKNGKVLEDEDEDVVVE
jgi:cytoskeletal protein RodZ